MDIRNFKTVAKPVRKKDAMQLLLGKPVYTDDVTPQDALVVKILRSPHPNAMIRSIRTDTAMKVPGMVAVYTWEDVPNKRYAIAGQTYPEVSPYDRLILDRHVRFVGDAVAIIAAETEKAANKAMKLIKVDYEVLEPVLDFHKALDNPILVHPEDDWYPPIDVGGSAKRNLVAHDCTETGDVEATLKDCDIVIEHTFHTKANQQAMMETFRTYSEIDAYGRIHVVASSQIVFHARRIIARALDIPKSRVRVSKPRIGGGFGAKQSAVCEFYPAFVTLKTGRPAKLIYTREECQIAGSPRHEMEVHVRLGANRDGRIRAMDIYTLSNSGAYGEHGPTTVGLTAEKPIPLYTANMEAHKFSYDVVYTNLQAAGAFRGYGAPQGLFAVESCVNELADMLDRDPTDLRLQNMVRQGMVMGAYHGETANACRLDECMLRCAEMFEWEKRWPIRDLGDGKVRVTGVSMAMQGSGISMLDVGGATIKLSDEGTYNLLVSAADMGTGSDTILAQIAAECMDCHIDDVAVYSSDTDSTPYDSGSYASSTTYLTGGAVVKACEELKGKIVAIAAEILGCDKADLVFEGRQVRNLADGRTVSLEEIAVKSQLGSTIAPESSAMHTSPVSPPPFMVGMVEIELDKLTGHVKIIDYMSVVDCGTPINPNLAIIQAESGIVQGIGMTLTEDVTYTANGKPMESSFMQYKIPTRLDMGKLRVELMPSYEPTGPWGAKSVGEVVINTPAPAIAHAIYRATGVWHRELPILPEHIAMSIKDN